MTGTATDANFLKYTLEIAPAGQANFTLLQESTKPVSSGTLGTLDPTTLLNDLLMQRTKMKTGRYSGPDYFTLD